MKVYLLSTGDYSDFRIRAAFSDRDTAQALADLLNGEDEAWATAQVHEFEVIDSLDPIQTFWVRSGMVRIVSKPDPTKAGHFHTAGEDPTCEYCTHLPEVFDQSNCKVVLWPWDGRPAKLGLEVHDFTDNPYRSRKEIVIEVRAETAERADKVYHDAVAKAKAKLAGVTD